MSQLIHHAVFYVEFPAPDLTAIKQFYKGVFGWTFQDYGPAYLAFEDGQLSGGFYQTDSPPGFGALVVLWSDGLEATQAAIEAVGGIISKPIFAFPGGRRFHFIDPGGNELAVCGSE